MIYVPLFVSNATYNFSVIGDGDNKPKAWRAVTFDLTSYKSHLLQHAVFEYSHISPSFQDGEKSYDVVIEGDAKWTQRSAQGAEKVGKLQKPITVCWKLSACMEKEGSLWHFNSTRSSAR
jgi:hypothetical protein